MTTATITHSSLNGGVPLNLLCSAIVPAITCNNSAIAADNKSYGLVEVQTKGIENPKIAIQGLLLRRDTANAFNETHLMTLAQIKYDGTNAPVLNVKYGRSTSTVYKSTTIVTTALTTSEELAKTLTINDIVPSVKYNVRVDDSAHPSSVRVVFNYSDATDEETIVSVSDETFVERTFTNPEPSKTVANVEVYVTPSFAATSTFTGTVSAIATVGEIDLVLLGGTKDIKVIYESSTIPFSVITSKDASIPVINMTLTETK